MPMININNVTEEFMRIKNKFNYDEIMELIKDLIQLAEIRHKEILQHQLKELTKK